MLGKMFIINAPMLFTTVWTVVKRMLDEVTVKKIQILGSNYKSALLEVIDADNLPEFLGGNCKIPLGDVGPWNDGTVTGFPDPEMEKVFISISSSLLQSIQKNKTKCDKIRFI
jgi:hypothetical protein